ncbi:MAG: efflux RND transporter periplasmic adaptor subunit [Cyanobacteria bacterium P01_H01_bin.15]
MPSPNERSSSVIVRAPERPAPTAPSIESSRSPWAALLVGVLLLGGGIYIGRLLPPPSIESAAINVETKPEPPPRPVETLILTRGGSEQQVQLIGQIEPRSRAMVRPQTDGIVRQIRVQPGDRVQVGELLAVLDDADQQLALLQAQARLVEAKSVLSRLTTGTRPEIIAQRQATVTAAKAREAEALDNLNRTQELVEAGALSQRVLIEAQTQLDAVKGERLEAAATLAEAEAGPRMEDIEAQQAVVAATRFAAEQAQLVLERTRIYAGKSGIVQERLASVGDYLEISDPLLTLVDSNQLDIFLEIPEDLSGQVNPGMPVTLMSRALPGWQLTVPINSTLPVADATSRRQQVRIQLDAANAMLIPGMAVQGQVTISNEVQGFVIPRDALTRRGTRWFVFTVDNNVAQQFEVDLIADIGEQVAIAHPSLRLGQQLVSQGSDGLRDGAAVKVVN